MKLLYVYMYVYLNNSKYVFEEIVLGSGFVSARIGHDQWHIITGENESPVFNPE